ncbi:GNAT family N-acetyltransferase [Mitsuaria sp. GD03876]|uniref:GNAT family N-acetyltransferase n=1 Tax=Mitsuaria sp. GD03876 TaxID=2975399 RepID=UPI002449E9AC|nr:GNAT family N-acetyltransferase [Mitsuaria sp. GD03876]MDH0863984.1 GNAT family N-acetyltransferase [Mitsuaria sp. GD03876]
MHNSDHRGDGHDAAITIVRVATLPDAARAADFSFDIDGRVMPPFDAPELRVEATPSRPKAYGLDDALFEPHDGDERVLFVAMSGDAVAGYVSASRDWNRCVLIDDIAIARPFRRHGLAGALMKRVEDWTRTIGLSAIRLETQSNNVAACRFYQRYGFELGGFDRRLYRELDVDVRDEVALFWYLSVDRDRGGRLAEGPTHRFEILSGSRVVGTSELEHGDPPMAIAYGRLWPTDHYSSTEDLRAIRSGTESRDQLAQRLAVRLAGGRELEGAKVFIEELSDETGVDEIHVTVLCASAEQYATLFPQHVAAYEAQFGA